MLQALNPKDARVLIVEDSPNDQEIAKRALKNFGIRHVSTARTAEDALIDLMKHRYDVALVDYNLPGMDGLRFMENLTRVSPDTKVIVVTGARQEKVAVAAMKLGASDYISKDEYLTSGITRSLQAALRSRIDEAEETQRDSMAVENTELERSVREVAWLRQALDERHGYRGSEAAPDETYGPDWSHVVDNFAAYIQASCGSFPEPASYELDAVLRVLGERGASPRDVLTFHMEALKSLMLDPEFASRELPMRPALTLTYTLACVVEELQLQLSLRDLAS